MNFRDQRLTCVVCGKSFIFTVTEQRKLSESGEVVTETRCQACRLQDPETGRWLGQIKWFSYEKGYGFIVKPNAEEIFFHRSQVVDEPLVSLEEGTQVTFEEAKTDRGSEAKQVKVASQ